MITLYVARENTPCHTCPGNNLYTCINKEKNQFAFFQHFTYCLVHSSIMFSSWALSQQLPYQKWHNFIKTLALKPRLLQGAARRLFSVKYLFRRSQYWLEISITRGRLNFSADFSIHVCFLNRFMAICIWWVLFWNRLVPYKNYWKHIKPIKWP